MVDYQDMLKITKNKLLKALGHLEYSYQIILSLNEHVEQMDEVSLAAWESFSVRFSRVVDLFLSKYMRVVVLSEDPAFTGTFRDFLNQAEKMKLIQDSKKWFEIRALRNITAHEYNDEDLAGFFKTLKKECPILLSIKELLG